MTSKKQKPGQDCHPAEPRFEDPQSKENPMNEMIGNTTERKKATVPYPDIFRDGLSEETPINRDQAIQMTIDYLSMASQVLARENSWLAPKVEFSRKIDDDTIKTSLERGWMDEEEATEKRAESTTRKSL